jgi:hypothetical protein
MYVDRLLRLSAAQAITGSAVSTDVLDLKIARDIGTGEELYLVTIVDTAMTDAGSDSTVTPTLQGSDAEAFGSGVEDLALFTIPAVTAAGKMFVARLAPGAAPLQKRYVRLNYVVANGNLTTGAFTSFITKDIQMYKSYKSASVVS